jgi:hypothetical protein
MRWAGLAALTGEKKNAYNIPVRKTEWEKPAGRPLNRREDNIKLEHKEVCGFY